MVSIASHQQRLTRSQLIRRSNVTQQIHSLCFSVTSKSDTLVLGLGVFLFLYELRNDDKLAEKSHGDEHKNERRRPTSRGSEILKKIVEAQRTQMSYF